MFVMHPILSINETLVALEHIGYSTIEWVEIGQLNNWIAEKITMEDNNKILKKAQYAITSNMGGNWVTSRTFCEKVGRRRNELTI